ncbi:MAG: hypothetical protein PVG08_07205 [Desulfobacterales bacterium]|jgi:hypothetical protein
MKRKYHGFLSAVLILIVLGLTAAFVVQKSWTAEDTVRHHPVKPLPQIDLPDSATLNKIDALEATLADLVNLPEPGDDRVDLMALGYDAGKHVNPVAADVETNASVRMDYSLTLTFCSDEKNYCIIDGKFASEGIYLSDGAKIIKIEPDRVMVQKKEIRSWIYPKNSLTTTLRDDPENTKNPALAEVQ